MYCIYCGKEIKKGTKFCPNCGQKINAVENTETSAGNKSSEKINSDSEKQPTSALVLLGVAALVFAYGIV